MKKPLMFISSIGHYLPERVVPNEYFLNLNGLTDEWIYTRTGIKERRRAAEHENTNTMALEALRIAKNKLTFKISEVDLIVGATYTPHDTVGSFTYEVQREFGITNAVSISISSACSSFVNAVEIVQGYFAMGKASKALVIASEHNSGYSDDTNSISGHLWGDGAVAVFITNERMGTNDIEINDIITRGLGHIGQGPAAVYLHPRNGGLIMPHGKDVFQYACTYMSEITREIISKNNITLADLDYFIPHQANIRIINYVADDLGIDRNKVIINIDKYGNTGSASSVIGLSQHYEEMPKDSNIVISVFGGGYSTGAILMKK